MFFIMTSYFFVVLSYLVGSIENIKTYGMNEIFLSISILLLGSYYIKERKQFFPNKKVKKIFLYMLLIFVVYQLLNINEFYIKETIKECRINLLVIINIYMFSGYIYYKKCEDRFIRITYLIISIFICIIYIFNFDNFQGVKQISMVFSNTDRYRNSYGLSHPNDTGLICYLALLLSVYLYKCSSYKKIVFRTLMFGLDTVIFIVLISTASRTAITSIVLFLIVFCFMKIKSKFNIDSSLDVFAKYIMIFFGAIFSIKIYISSQGIDFTEFIAQTNRIANYTINIPILFMNHKELFGMGYFNAIAEQYGGTPYLDNWYLYMFLTTGIIGLILSILLIIKVYLSISKNNEKSLIEIFTISYFVSQLYYSLFETQFFRAQFLNTFIFWIFIFITILYKKQHKKV